MSIDNEFHEKVSQEHKGDYPEEKKRSKYKSYIIQINLFLFLSY